MRAGHGACRVGVAFVRGVVRQEANRDGFFVPGVRIWGGAMMGVGVFYILFDEHSDLWSTMRLL